MSACLYTGFYSTDFFRFHFLLRREHARWPWHQRVREKSLGTSLGGTLDRIRPLHVSWLSYQFRCQDVGMITWQNKADHVVSISKHAPADGCHIWINYEDVESVCISAILLLTILGLLQYITPLLPLFQATISRNVKLNYSFCEK